MTTLTEAEVRGQRGVELERAVSTIPPIHLQHMFLYVWLELCSHIRMGGPQEACLGILLKVIIVSHTWDETVSPTQQTPCVVSSEPIFLIFPKSAHTNSQKSSSEKSSQHLSSFFRGLLPASSRRHRKCPFSEP